MRMWLRRGDGFEEVIQRRRHCTIILESGARGMFHEVGCA